MLLAVFGISATGALITSIISLVLAIKAKQAAIESISEIERGKYQ